MHPSMDRKNTGIKRQRWGIIHSSLPYINILFVRSLGTNFLQIELYFWWTHDLYWSLINCYLNFWLLWAGCRLKFISLYLFLFLFNSEIDESIENTIEETKDLRIITFQTVHSVWCNGAFNWKLEVKKISFFRFSLMDR